MRKILSFILLVFLQITFAQKYIDIREFGGIANDGSSDDLALSEAFDEALSSNASGVYLPEGSWHFDYPIRIPRGLTLKGTYTQPHHAEKKDLTHGTTIECYAGQNLSFESSKSIDYSCIYLHGTSTLEGVNIVYPEQKDPFNPKPYPWTIFCNSNYDKNANVTESARCSIINTTLVNSYAGIFMEWSANDHYIKGVNMSVFRKGISMDGITSLGILEDINIHNQYSWSFYGFTAASPEVNNLIQNNKNYMTGIEFHRVDWGWLKNVFVIYANKGFVFDKSKKTKGKSQWEFGTRALPSLNIQNSGCDLCEIAIQANYINPSIGINFTNSNLLGQIILGDECYGPLRIHNASLSEGLESANIQSHIYIGKHSTLQIANTEILTFGAKEKLGWKGNTFTVKGTLQLSNSVIAWPDTTRFNNNFASHILVESNGTALLNNTIFRGPNFRKNPRSKGKLLVENSVHQIFNDSNSYLPPF